MQQKESREDKKALRARRVRPPPPFPGPERASEAEAQTEADRPSPAPPPSDGPQGADALGVADSMNGNLAWPTVASLQGRPVGAGVAARADVPPRAQSRRVLQVAVLVCEHMSPGIAASHGAFADIFRTWLASGARRFNSRRPRCQHVAVRASGWDVTRGEYPPKLHGIDALVVTGSVHGVYDDAPWIPALARYLQDVYRTQPRVRLFGSCFGHQLLAQALLGEHGARVERCADGWEVGLHEVRHDAAFVRCFPGLVRPTTAYQFLHLDHVVLKTALPPGWVSVGASNLCPLQGLYQPGRVLTYQGHPEFDNLVVRDIVTRLGRGGALAADVYEEALALRDRGDSRARAAEVLVEFLAMS